MKNIHVLPTDKPTGIFKLNDSLLFSIINKVRSNNEGFHLYITSDEKIKEGDWWLNIKTNDVDKCTHKSEVSVYNSQKYQHIKKIILTTDPDLIKDGVQAIDDEFLEWFVKNPNCEWVDIETMMECEKCGKEHCDNLQCRGYKDIPYYKIIIPKEEPKQETLEEAAEKYSENWEETTGLDYENTVPSEVNKLDFINGAKWQAERMYSEEGIIDLIQFLSMNKEFNEYSSVSKETARYFLEQFKKK